MLTRRLLPILLAISTVLLSGSAHGAFTSTYATVTYVEVADSSYNSGKVIVLLDGETCPHTGDFVILDSREDKFELVKVLLTSMLSGIEVKLGYAQSGNDCSVYAVRLYKPV